MSKFLIRSDFHGREKIITIKDDYAHDPLNLLDYVTHTKGIDRPYAARKLKEIKNALCGVHDCACEIRVVDRVA